jgi:hypothetical protein
MTFAPSRAALRALVAAMPRREPKRRNGAQPDVEALIA